VPWSLEVCNDDVWGHPGADHVRAAADGMRRVLEQARATAISATTETTTTTTTTIDQEMP
jgi:hypothetical protein